MRIVHMANGIVEFWLLDSSPLKSPFYSHSCKIKGNDMEAHIIDQYGGKQPYLVDETFVKKGRSLMTFSPILLLDSHIASQLGRLINITVANKCQMKFDEGIAILIPHVLEKKIDTTAIFYYLESYVKSNVDMFYTHVIEAAKGIVTFQAVNKDKLLYERKIVLDDEIMENYFKRFSTFDLKMVAEREVESVCTFSMINEVKSKVNLFYILLMKMVLIKKLGQGVILWNVKKFYEFMLEDVGRIFGRELFLSLYYFSNLTGRFINIESNMSFENAKKSLIRSSWDLFLMRFPEIILNKDAEGVTTLAYVCTAEKKLQEIGNLFTLDCIIRGKCALPALNITMPMFLFEGIRSKLGDEMAGEIEEWLKKTCLNRLYELKDMQKHEPRDLERVKHILENELKQYCC